MANSDLESKNVSGVKKKVKERKGKKEKDAVAGVPDNRETLPGIIIKVRKHKRIKDAEIPVESENISANPEVEEKGKKKKRKRDRRDEEQPSEEKKKKKQKKDTTSVDTSDYATSSALATMAVDTSEAKPKAKEKKRTESKQLTEPSDPSPSAIGPTPSAEAADLCTESSSRPKSKSRKRKKDVVPEDQEQSTAARAEDHSSRKRKRSNLSTYLDPSDDPDLVDQSQKALTYVYSHSTSPKTWKFNKARQNWIIRNIWTPKIPEKYVPMVVEYLSKVQGRVRETLIESCKTVISDPNPEPPATGTGTGSDDKNSSENAVPSTPTAITYVEKRNRAETLLHALTKRPQPLSG